MKFYQYNDFDHKSRCKVLIEDALFVNFSVRFGHALVLLLVFNPLIHDVPKWSGTLKKSCSICCNVFEVCQTILGHYTLKD